MTAKVPTIDIGIAREGMMVAERLRRNRKMTSTTRPRVTSSVSLTSLTDSWMDSERSKRIRIDTEAGSCCSNDGSSSLIGGPPRRCWCPAGAGSPARWPAGPRTRRRSCRSPRCRTPVRAPPAAPACPAVGDDDRSVAGRVVELAVGLDGVGPVGPHSTPVGQVGVVGAARLRVTSSMPIPAAASLRGSSWMRTAYFWEP